jgi:hypothetical protein
MYKLPYDEITMYFEFTYIIPVPDVGVLVATVKAGVVLDAAVVDPYIPSLTFTK